MERGSGHTTSPWMQHVELPALARMKKDVEAEVCVIGAGIAGLSTAYALAKAGRSVVVLEDGEIGSGETSRTTAHLATAFDDRYSTVEHLHGEEGARLTAESHAAAIDWIEQVVHEERIECQFERLDGYLFVPPGDPTDELERELVACHRAGLTEVEFVARAPIEGFETGRSLRFPRQAQFHPIRYLAALAAAIERRGGRIYTHTHATAIEAGQHGGRGHVGTVAGPTVTARDLVVATNTPVQDLITLHTKQYPYRTYVIAGRIPPGAVTDALFWDTARPYHYVRRHRAGNRELLIAGGEDHRTGRESDGEDRLERLVRWTRERFPAMKEVVYQWSGQVMEPVDALAFIGRNPGDEHLWVVTGDSGNGMTHGALAGLLLRDLILGHEHPWARLYDPSRKSLRTALDYTRENLNTVAQYASWVTGGDVDDVNEIPPGSGAILREGLHKLAVYRDCYGNVHRMTATCPHLGAIVRWNEEEETWDCPAHGSRFDCRGHVVNGPANGDLAPAEEKTETPEPAPVRTRRTAGSRHPRHPQRTDRG